METKILTKVQLKNLLIKNGFRQGIMNWEKNDFDKTIDAGSTTFGTSTFIKIEVQIREGWDNEGWKVSNIKMLTQQFNDDRLTDVNESAHLDKDGTDDLIESLNFVNSLR